MHVRNNLTSLHSASRWCNERRQLNTTTNLLWYRAALSCLKLPAPVAFNHSLRDTHVHVCASLVHVFNLHCCSSQWCNKACVIMYTTGHMLRDEVIALHAFAAQCHGVQTMRVFNVYPNSKYTVVWGPRRYHYLFGAHLGPFGGWVVGPICRFFTA